MKEYFCRAETCNVRLNDENWYISNKNKKDYICKNCVRLRNQKNRKKRKGKGINIYPYETNKKYRLKSRFGMTLEDEINILNRQNHKCPISNVELNVNNYHIDHIKNTKIVRGILLNKINMALGLFDHNVFLIKSAIWYLQNDMLRRNIKTIIEENKPKYNKIPKNWNKNQRMKNNSLKSLYGIPLYDYYDIIKLQGGGCTIVTGKQIGRAHV